MKPSESGDDIIAEFQERRRQFQPRWNRNWIFVFLPGFLLLGAGGPAGLLLPGGTPNDLPWLLIPGIGLCLIGMARAVQLMMRYRRCPVCDAFQAPTKCFPYRTCAGCGARLSIDWKDST